jgi:predicted DCC family thiol-disulfide oxidoreductase YuxK
VVDEYGLDEREVESRIYSLDSKTGHAFSGIHTVLQIFLRIPAYWLMVPFVWVSIRLGLGQPVYDWIAKRRNLIPIGKCSNGACSIDRRDGKDAR